MAVITSRRRDERGAAAVEFALVLIPFTVLMFGIIQYGFYFWTAESVNTAARESARRIVVGDCWDKAKLANYADDYSSSMTHIDYTPTLIGSTVTVGQEVTVTVTADADILGFLPVPDGGVITRTYDARMETDQRSDPGTDTCS